MKTSPTESLKSVLYKACTILILIAVLLVLIEGVSSFVLSAHNILNQTGSEIFKYDPRLGWTGNPGKYVPNEYGDGKDVRINDNGFRSSVNTNVKVEGNQIRILCSGDSFTFGQGVANNSTWCHLLALNNDAIETVNLSQIGYGVDQMYLRYLHDGLGLEHSIHLFAFISGDLDRMLFDGKFGYGKPTLSVDNEGKILVNNVPVPHLRWKLHRLIEKADLRVVELAQRAFAKLMKKDRDNFENLEEIKQVATRVMLDVHKTAVDRNIIPIFIYLPVEGDLVNDLPWRTWASENMKKYELNYLDLTPMLRYLAAEEVSKFFIPKSSKAKNHYTEAGNVWVANTILNNIQKFPNVKNLINPHNKSIKLELRN